MHTFVRNGIVHVDARGEGRGRFSLGVREGDTLGVAAALAKHFGGGAKVTPLPSTPSLAAMYTRALATHYASPEIKDRKGVVSRWEHGILKYARSTEPAFTDSTPVGEISKEKVALFRAWCIAEGNDPKTANRKVALVSKLLHLAEEWGVIAHAPKIKRPKEKRGRIRWLSDAEEATVLAFFAAGAGGGGWSRAADGSRVPSPDAPREGAADMADAVTVLIDTGLRLGELLALADADVRLDAEPTVYVWSQKGGSSECEGRAVPLTARAAAILARRGNREQGAQRGTSRPFGNLTQDRCGALWALARAAMGLAHDAEFVIHSLRHTFAVRMVESGVDIRVLQRLMGHAKVETTEVYAHVSPKAARGAVEALEARARRVSEAPVRLAVAR